MRLYELNYPKQQIGSIGNSLAKANQIMIDNGFVLLGQGANANVYQHPKLNYVVKLFYSDDESYKKFVELALEIPNPHFPKFIGRIMNITQSVCGIRMEKLTPITERYMLYLYQAEDALATGQEMPEHVEETYPELEEACILLHDYQPSGTETDLHAANVMLRNGNFPVITDPWVERWLVNK